MRSRSGCVYRQPNRDTAPSRLSSSLIEFIHRKLFSWLCVATFSRLYHAFPRKRKREYANEMCTLTPASLTTIEGNCQPSDVSRSRWIICVCFGRIGCRWERKGEKERERPWVKANTVIAAFPAFFLSLILLFRLLQYCVRTKAICAT
jgi:hypothetical protein